MPALLALLTVVAVAPTSAADDKRPPGSAQGTDLFKRHPGAPLLSPPLLPVEKLRLTLGEVLREADADPELGPPEEPVSAGTWVIRVLPVLLVPSALLLWRRRRRLNTAPAAPAVSPLRRAAVGRSRRRWHPVGPAR
ncbi:hypothetical protein [Streptomyces leeuwenhoekii]|uniref:Secreted Protein n=1 Tax=Streptomyces leeuwenhoekii TaxID=1437453 RepID=A0A0F7W645_STRLW|nr:hypothetical protein [Streptomyces leeuwenhoekii]CQR66163.1 Hypothetical Protein sle_67090 [Streptomyces leeuwenhoekii]